MRVAPPSGFTGADERRLREIAGAKNQIQLVKIATVEGSRVVGFAISGSPDGSLVVYGESVVPSLSQIFFFQLPRGLEFALYIHDTAPRNLLASSTSLLPIRGETINEPLRLVARTWSWWSADQAASSAG